MNPDLKRLQPYPFQKLSKLFSDCSVAENISEIRLSIGEPRHASPDFIANVLTAEYNGIAHYPLTKGSEPLRESIASWLQSRYTLPIGSINPALHILPVNGTREALFAFAQTIVDRTASNPLVMMPNPFYQIYEGATLLAGAKPFFINCTRNSDFLPDLDVISASEWDDCQLIYLCSPGNPTGAVLPIETMQALINLAHRHDFIIASDECYSEIYYNEDMPPVGLLEASNKMGNTDFSRCMVFHSLSKRSNLPGLRSGFVAGDSALIENFHLFRTYHGCAMSPPVQAASRAAWEDEAHVRTNRQFYRDKFSVVKKILSPKLNSRIPAASFYLWLEINENDEKFARRLYQEHNTIVLPGSYLSRNCHGHNPGEGYVRIALVADINSCIDAAKRIVKTVQY